MDALNSLTRTSLRKLAVWAFFFALWAAHAASLGAANDAATTNEAEKRIAALITELGAADFAARENAQSALAQLGLEAFDALHAAQNHDDPEIALRSRYLVRSMSVRWFSESDAPETVRLLQGYGDLAEGERRNRMDKLAALEGRQGILPLCRLARFETVDPLAKYAALQVIEAPPPEAAEAKAAFIKAVREITGSSKRSASQWLRTYAKTLAEPASALAEWDEATQAEQALLTKTQDRTSAEIVRDLYRYQVELLRRLQREDEAANVTRRMFGLLDKAPDKISEFVGWLAFTKAWPHVLELGEKFAPAFETNPQLLYRLAQAHQELGQQEKADAAALRALALNPENLDRHVDTAIRLEHELGLVKWAEQELQHVIKLSAPDSATTCKARVLLCELLHDQLRELEAAEAIQPVCEMIKKNEAYKDVVIRVRPDSQPESLIPRMNYFYSCHYLEQQDYANQRKHLELALSGEDSDADVLIAMYRLKDADEAFRAKTKERIEAAIKDYRGEVETELANLRRAGDLGFNREILATSYNQYAWLVGNTVGDYDEAVEFSHKSLELRPNYGGFLDTLGRCYYAKGDLVNAVKYQTRAAKITFHSGQIRRQLEFFIKEAKDRGIVLPPEEPGPTIRASRTIEVELP